MTTTRTSGTWGGLGGWTMRLAAGLLTAAAILVSPVALHAHAQPLRVTAVGEQYIPLRIAIPDFDATGPGAADIARQLSDVIRSDLGASAPFRVLDKAGFIERDLDITMQPIFGNWTVAGLETQALVVGNVVVDPATNKLTVQFRLWDVYGQKMQYEGGYAYPTPLNWRRLAHKVADDIFTQLTGDPGYFDSRIAFVSKTPGEEPFRGRLAIMDQDGANAEFLLSGRTAVINPRFSPNPKDQIILYGAYVEDPRYPAATLLRTYLYDTVTGRQEVLDEGQGQLDFSARFSPDGRSIVFSRAVGGNTDIYMIDLATRKRTRLTTDSAIDVSPSFSPDGKQIVFQSDRGGSKQLYIMNADGTPTTCASGQRADACRITFAEPGYSFTDPVWSPRGDWIAFSRQGGGQFVIGVIQSDGKGMRILTDGYQDESPTWSPNGRVIAFERTASRAAGPKLYSIDLTGRNERRLPTPRDATNPTWGPVLPME